MFGAVVEGRAAAMDDQLLSNNPYESGTAERVKWFAGWVEAHEVTLRTRSDTISVTKSRPQVYCSSK